VEGIIFKFLAESKGERSAVVARDEVKDHIVGLSVWRRGEFVEEEKLMNREGIVDHSWRGRGRMPLFASFTVSLFDHLLMKAKAIEEQDSPS
jgi:hypothetical protein